MIQWKGDWILLDFRLQLLKDSGQIGDATFERVRDLVLFLEKRTGHELTEENAAMLVTHFSIAVERAYRKENVNAMEDATRMQIESSPRYPTAMALLDEWRSGADLPDIHENERDFLLLHLCVLLENLNVDAVSGL